MQRPPRPTHPPEQLGRRTEAETQPADPAGPVRGSGTAVRRTGRIEGPAEVGMPPSRRTPVRHPRARTARAACPTTRFGRCSPSEGPRGPAPRSPMERDAIGRRVRRVVSVGRGSGGPRAATDTGAVGSGASLRGRAAGSARAGAAGAQPDRARAVLAAARSGPCSRPCPARRPRSSDAGLARGRRTPLRGRDEAIAAAREIAHPDPMPPIPTRAERVLGGRPRSRIAVGRSRHEEARREDRALAPSGVTARVRTKRARAESCRAQLSGRPHVCGKKTARVFDRPPASAASRPRGRPRRGRTAGAGRCGVVAASAAGHVSAGRVRTGPAAAAGWSPRHRRA